MMGMRQAKQWAASDLSPYTDTNLGPRAEMQEQTQHPNTSKNNVPRAKVSKHKHKGGAWRMSLAALSWLSLNLQELIANFHRRHADITQNQAGKAPP